MKYHITMNKDDFFRVHKKIKAYNVMIILEDVSFDCDYSDYKIIKSGSYDYKVEQELRNRIYIFITKYKYILLGIIFMMSIIYINSYRYTEIVFNKDTPINENIKNEITNKSKDLFIFKFINMDFIDYSNNLRVKYSSYPYIHVYQKYNKIYVDVHNYDETVRLDNNTIGDIVAKSDGIVDVYYVYQGKCLVNKNKYVKEGDVLVSSEYNDSLVQASALVLGYTYEKINIEIDKEETIQKNSGNIDEYYNISLFNLDFNLSKDSNYKKMNTSNEKIFNLFSFFSISKVKEEEICDIINKNTYENAYEKAIKIINTDFNNSKECDKEEICDLVLYSKDESTDKFTFTFIAKKYISLGKFIEK